MKFDEARALLRRGKGIQRAGTPFPVRPLKIVTGKGTRVELTTYEFTDRDALCIMWSPTLEDLEADDWQEEAW